MGKWIDRLKQQKKSENINPTYPQNHQNPPKGGFGGFDGTYPKRFHEKKGAPSSLVEIYPDFHGWGLSKLRAWKRCLECEWAWWVNGAHMCLDQDEKRMDFAMKTCRRISHD